MYFYFGTKSLIGFSFNHHHKLGHISRIIDHLQRYLQIAYQHNCNISGGVLTEYASTIYEIIG